MDVVRFSLDKLPEPSKGLSLALGNFDGLHIGHQRLFVETALHAKGDSAVLFFKKPYGGGPILTDVEDKLRLSLPSRLDRCYVLENDESLFDMEAEEFIEKVLVPLGTARVVVGEDFRFGQGAKGNPELLKKYFDVEIVPLLQLEGSKVSSSAIKALLFEDEVELATEWLGRPYELRGIISKGLGNGRTIGFPTANLELAADYVLPLPGVYCGVAYVSGIAYRAMINVGTNPTVGKLDQPIVEAHLLDFDKECYGQTCYVSFLRFIREEKRFDSLEELRKQLVQDEATVREMLA